MESYGYDSRFEFSPERIDSSPIFLAFQNVCRDWKLDDSEATTLLGLETQIEYRFIRSGITGLGISKLDKLERIRMIFNIQVGLYEKFENNGEKQKNWLRAERKELGGKSPLEYMLQGGIAHLFTVESLSRFH